MFADTWYLFNKYVKITIRTPMWTLFTLVQPLIWLIIFGQLFKNMASLPGFPTDNYTDFFVPGVLIMTVLFGSSWSGVSLLREITAGTVDKMLVSPVSRTAIVLSRVMHSAVQVLLQSLIMLGVAWAMGATLSANPFYIFLSLVVIFFLGVAFASISNGFAMMLQREEPLVIIGNMMTLPLMFFSTALVPASFMPGWIKVISNLNPINYAVESVRAVLVGPPQWGIYIKGFVVLAAFAGITVYWAVNAFKQLRD